jgi:hypothetical protein
MNKILRILSVAALTLLAQTSWADDYLTGDGRHNGTAVHTSFKQTFVDVTLGTLQFRAGTCLYGISLNKKGHYGDSITLPNLSFAKAGQIVAGIERTDGTNFEITTKNLDPTAPPESASSTYSLQKAQERVRGTPVVVAGLKPTSKQATTNWSIGVKNLSDKPVYVMICLLESRAKTADEITKDTVINTMLDMTGSNPVEDNAPLYLPFGQVTIVGGIVAKNSSWTENLTQGLYIGWKIFTYPGESAAMSIIEEDALPIAAIKPSAIMPVPKRLPLYQLVTMTKNTKLNKTVGIKVENPSGKPQYAASLIIRK